MKKRNQIAIVMLLMVWHGVSCSRYDNPILSPVPRIIRSDYDSIRVYPDSVIYIFNSHLIARTGEQLFYPIHFRINLPGKWEYAKSVGLYAFGFLYDEKQTIYIWVDMYADRVRKGESLQDTLFRVSPESEADLDDLLYGRLSIVSTESRFDIEKNEYDKNRETFIIRKGKATIVLYNIKKEQSAVFLKAADGLEFIK